MATIRDAKTNETIDVEDDGRRLTFELSREYTHQDHSDECDCDCDPGTATVTLNRDDLIALLGRK